MNNNQLHSILIVSVLSSILILDLAASTVILLIDTSNFGVFAIPVPTGFRQTINWSEIDKLATLVQNKTGINKSAVESVIYQIANYTTSSRSQAVGNNVVANLTYLVKQPGTDIVSQSLYLLAKDRVSGDMSKVDQAVSRFVQRIDGSSNNNTNIVQQLSQTTIEVIGDAPLKQNIDYIATQVASNTGADQAAVKKLLYPITIQTANVLSEDISKNSINKIYTELQQDPAGLISQSISRLAQVHFYFTDWIIKYAIDGHVDIPAAINGVALRTIGGYSIDLGIYQLASLLHVKYGVDQRAAQHVLQLMILMIGNTGGNPVANNTLTAFKHLTLSDPYGTFQSLFQLAKYQAMGESDIVYGDIVRFVQQVDNGQNALEVLKTVIPPDPNYNPPCRQSIDTPGCPHIVQTLSP